MNRNLPGKQANAQRGTLASIHRPNLGEAFCWTDPTDVILMVVTGVALLPLTLLRLVHRFWPGCWLAVCRVAAGAAGAW
jgi:hypothetical protein